jgi:peptide/nickel transport system substrate-binding protein
VAVAVEGPTGTLNIGWKELGTFGTHPRLYRLTFGGSVGATIGESLVRENPTSFVPELAREWSLSPDSLVWTFKLHEGVQFHQGYGEMTAEDVIYSIQQAGAEGSGYPSSGRFKRLWLHKDGWVKAPDAYTIEVHTGTRQYDMLGTLGPPYGGWVVSKKQVDELGEEAADVNGALTGPWEVEEIKTGVSWRFKAVEDHWRKTPNFAEMVFWEMPEESTRVANFQVGKLDSFQMALDSKPAVEKVPGTKFMRVESGGTEHLGLYGNWYVGHGGADHQEKRPGYDPDLPWVSINPDVNSPEWERARKVRLAMAIAIDRQLIVDTLLSGEGHPLYLWGWENNLDRLPADIQKGWEYNPEKAKQLLVEAGYGDGFEITLTASVRGVPGEQEACEAVGTMWEAIGIRTRIDNVPYATIGPQLQNRDYNQASCHGTGGRTDPLWLISAIVPSTAGWTGGFDHPWLDETIDKAVSIVDQDERYKVMTEIARFMFDNVVEQGLYSANLLWPLGPNIDEWKQHLNFADPRYLSSYEYAPHRK